MVALEMVVNGLNRLCYHLSLATLLQQPMPTLDFKGKPKELTKKELRFAGCLMECSGVNLL